MTDNAKIITNINQYFHNAGIKQESRFDILVDILKNNETERNTEPVGRSVSARSVREERATGTTINQVLYQSIRESLNILDYTNKDLIQELFMKIGSKYTKFKLDQFYTPLTLSYFISTFMDPTKNAIDPAGGTGDLLLYFKGTKTIWDIDENSLKLCLFNYQLNQQSDYNLQCKNSLVDFEEGSSQYSYVTMNPPFGSSTNITDKNILDKYNLGKNKKKQEIGILFLELGMKLLKDDGILFIIVPSGYIGNKNNIYVELRDFILQHKIIALLELPKNTFKRSGTGVNTYLLIIQKTPIKPPPYEIFISGVDNIGYDLCKKDTPIIYKINETTGDILYDILGNPIRNNDLDIISTKIQQFCIKNNIQNTKICSIGTTGDIYQNYEYVMSNQLDQNILDIKRYKNLYKDVVQQIISNSSFKKICDMSQVIKKITKIDKTIKYKYIDIGQITTPLYGYSEMYGWNLPSRAKYTVQKYDILVSKLEGNISYCVILDDEPNIIATNGVAVLRPNSMDDLYILFSNIMKKPFQIQHSSFTTGSIMASLTDEDIGNMYIDLNQDIQQSKKIVETLYFLVKLQKHKLQV